mgnify:CR=1 FL=1
MNYTLDQLRALEAVNRTGSFAAAAQELGRATSAISYAIKTLESALNVEIFDRSGHRARLTSAGELVLLETARVLTQARRLEQVGRELERGFEPALSVVLDGILPVPPVMRALRAFSDLGLPTRVHMMVEYLGGVVRKFEDLAADVMMVVDYEGDHELSAVPLPPVEVFLLAHRDHPLHQRDRTLDRDDLADHVELVVADSSHKPPGSTHRLFLGSPQLFQLSDFHTKTQALLHGVGYGWLPGHLAAEHMRSGELLEVGFEEGSRHVFEPHLVHRKHPPIGPAGKILLEKLLHETAIEPLVHDF